MGSAGVARGTVDPASLCGRDVSVALPVELVTSEPLVDVVEGTNLGSKLVALYLDTHGASVEAAYIDAVATIDFVLSQLDGDKRRLVVITPYIRGIRDYWKPTHTLNNRMARYLDGGWYLLLPVHTALGILSH